MLSSEAVKIDVNAGGLFQDCGGRLVGVGFWGVIDIDDNGERGFAGLALWENSPWEVSVLARCRQRAKTLMAFGLGLEGVGAILEKVSAMKFDSYLLIVGQISKT